MAGPDKTPPLWLSLQFPHLALDLATRGQEASSDRPVAISDDGARKRRVLDCNPAAARAGIKPGLPVSAALGLCGALHLVARNVRAEQQALERLAAWAYRYSSQVSIASQGRALVLEIGASRRLFGAAEDLARHLGGELLRLGYHVQTGTAPTPQAAHLAARHNLHIPERGEIHPCIGKLPLESLALDRAQMPALQKMGFRTIGEILRLPRKALARRMGTDMVDYLDRLTGARPDPQPSWHPPEHHASGVDLAPGVSGNLELLFPLRRLVAELCGVLRARDRGIQELHVHLKLDGTVNGRNEECLRLGLQQPTRSESRILLLLRERLERHRPPRPIRRIELRARRLLPYVAHHDTLFRAAPDTGTQPVGPLLERLRARLGADAVRGLRGVQDHRPEYSWSVRELGEPADCAAMSHRPVWLFASPQRCRIGDYRVLAGPERIESGWWDGHDCRRDYFVVRDPSGCTMWAFREHKPNPGWYLQGLFA